MYRLTLGYLFLICSYDVRVLIAFSQNSLIENDDDETTSNVKVKKEKTATSTSDSQMDNKPTVSQVINSILFFLSEITVNSF